MACSLLATVLLAQQELSHFAGQPLALVYVFSAAIAWGIGNAMIKNAKLSISSVSLTFWFLLAGAVVFSLFAIALFDLIALGFILVAMGLVLAPRKAA